jgi:hypothetical protein
MAATELVNTVKSFDRLNDDDYLVELFYTCIEKFVASFLSLHGFITNVLRLIEEMAKARVRAAIRALARRTEAVKALHKPIIIVPHSLHPDEAAA